ncbi:hypothetical protein H4R33_004708 [Dimargaris cristalligena]|uniref:Uncharacterized protein n=1 Tax=Dimargaris cristalligena TaxID=215637 RepID=A0A4P9ZV55_9FUNG|nr:hypothetical protein H4R33_004708 [Dimargaris cristalligena]RKP37455.1 hypothetical protein BJ085DRAFT_39940 [Dimargaris cristalligena]|eukprot:RKP37455.1 hypothetical protein BJ085DRAFT_39940 [Dimargaris cristalligena]
MPRRRGRQSRRAERHLDDEESDHKDAPGFLDEEEQEKVIKDLKFEDEKLNAQFKDTAPQWFMIQAYYMAIDRNKMSAIPFLGFSLATTRPLLSCEFSVICLQLGLYGLYKDHFSPSFLVGSSALFVFQFWLCVHGLSPIERIWWSLPALMLAFDLYVGYVINVQGIRWSELEARKYNLKSA